MPFRLDEIPFFDTTYLCEPAQITNFTTYEEEVEPWDAPLRRRNNVSSHISSHLYHVNRRESHYSDIGSEDGILVNEPYNRDPDVPLKKINARRYDQTPRPSISVSPVDQRPFCYSPTPYSKPSVGNLREKFGSDSDRNRSLKKRSAPKPPSDYYNDQLEQRSTKGPAPAPPRSVSPYRAPKTDPIREMENIGKKDVR
jgi:myosin III